MPSNLNIIVQFPHLHTGIQAWVQYSIWSLNILNILSNKFYLRPYNCLQKMKKTWMTKRVLTLNQPLNIE